MKQILVFFLALCILSCDDGDVLVASLDFDNSNIQICNPEPEDGTYIFYKINNETNEVLLLTLSAADLFANLEVPTEITLNGTSQSLEYRRYNGTIPNNFFCTNSNSASPIALETLTASAGTVTISNSIDITEMMDGSVPEDDNDGIPAVLEGIVFTNGLIDDAASDDTDNDGIPDYKDEDDDGDNIRTIDEGAVLTPDGLSISDTSRDTDNNMIYDYLDCDDDGDGTPTSQEDVNGDLNPGNDIALPGQAANYLLSSVSVQSSPVIQDAIEHSFSRDVNVTIVLNNVLFSSGDASVIDQEFDYGSVLLSSVSVTVPADLNPCP